jgi:hypothetical protein
VGYAPAALTHPTGCSIFGWERGCACGQANDLWHAERALKKVEAKIPTAKARQRDFHAASDVVQTVL